MRSDEELYGELRATPSWSIAREALACIIHPDMRAVARAHYIESALKSREFLGQDHMVLAMRAPELRLWSDLLERWVDANEEWLITPHRPEERGDLDPMGSKRWLVQHMRDELERRAWDIEHQSIPLDEIEELREPDTPWSQWDRDQYVIEVREGRMILRVMPRTPPDGPGASVLMCRGEWVEGLVGARYRQPSAYQRLGLPRMSGMGDPRAWLIHVVEARALDTV